MLWGGLQCALGRDLTQAARCGTPVPSEETAMTLSRTPAFSRAVKIAPSILAADFANFGAECRAQVCESVFDFFSFKKFNT